MKFLLSSKLRGNLLRQQIVFMQHDTFLVIPVCTMPSYISDETNWAEYFGSCGKLSCKIRTELSEAGATPENIFFYNYLRKELPKLDNYSQILLSGGDAELGLARLTTSGLGQALTDYGGTIIAYSAGALLLLQKYFLSPNYYYSSLTTHSGMGLISADFTLEVHYDASEKMRGHIRKAMEVLNLPVVAIGNGGAVTYDADQCKIDFVGDVEIFV